VFLVATCNIRVNEAESGMGVEF